MIKIKIKHFLHSVKPRVYKTRYTTTYYWLGYELVLKN
jgi:hypothetical protein